MIKVFKGSSIYEVLESVKEEMGEDAVIISTNDTGSEIEVTASDEEEKPLELHASIDDLPALTFDFITNEHSSNLEDTPPEIELMGTAIMLTGLPGVGKTSIAAKLALESLNEGKTVAIVTIDIAKAGAYEQLKVYGESLDIPTYKITNLKEYKIMMASLIQSRDLVIVDTPGLNPYIEGDIEFIEAFVEAFSDIKKIGVFAADSTLGGATLNLFHKLHCQGVILSRVDLTDHNHEIETNLMNNFRDQLTVIGMNSSPEIAEPIKMHHK